MILPLDPGPEAAVERLQAVDVIAEVAKPAGPKGAEEALDLTLSRWLERSCVNQRNAEPGADQGEMTGAVGASVVDVQAGREAAPDQRVLEHRQERRSVLRHGEGGERDDAGGVVDEGDQVGLAPGSAVPDLGSVHDVAHPHLAGMPEGEAAAIRPVGRLLVEQALAAEEAVHGGRGERVVDTLLLDLLDDGANRQCVVLGLQRDEALGDLGRQPPGLPPVGAGLGVERVEAAVAVVLDPAPHGLGGDPGPGGSGDRVGLLGFGAHHRAGTRCTHGQMHQIGDDVVSEERDLLAKVVV